MVGSILTLLGMPIGTIMGILLLIYLFSSEVKDWFFVQPTILDDKENTTDSDNKSVR